MQGSQAGQLLHICGMLNLMMIVYLATCKLGIATEDRAREVVQSKLGTPILQVCVLKLILKMC